MTDDQRAEVDGGRGDRGGKEHPMTPAVPDPTVEADPLWVRMVMDVADQLWQAGNKRASGDLHEALRRARAAAPDALRVKVKALLAELPMDSTGHVIACGYSDETLGGCDCYTLPARLRALLDDPALAGRATGGEG